MNIEAWALQKIEEMENEIKGKERSISFHRGRIDFAISLLNELEKSKPNPARERSCDEQRRYGERDCGVLEVGQEV